MKEKTICVTSERMKICEGELIDCKDCEVFNDRIRIKRLTEAEIINYAGNSTDQREKLRNISDELSELSDRCRLSKTCKVELSCLIFRLSNLQSEMDLTGTAVFYNLLLNSHIKADSEEEAIQ